LQPPLIKYYIYLHIYKNKKIEVIFMDSENVYIRTLLEYTVSEKYSTASARRAKVFDAKERGYCSIKLPEDLMDTLNQNFGVRETLSNLVKYTHSSEFVFQDEDAVSETRLLRTLVIKLTNSLKCLFLCLHYIFRKMVYMGYDFDTGKIKNLRNKPKCVKESLSKERLDKAKDFLKSVGNFIASKLDLFRKGSFLSKDAVAITLMENFTGQDGFPASEENQSYHTDYAVDPSK